MIPETLAKQSLVDHLESFWEDFAVRNWEKKPLAIKDLFDTMPISADALFQTVARCCEGSSIKSGVVIRFFIDGERQRNNADIFHLLPHADDKSFEGYNERMLSVLQGKSYFMVINNPEIVDVDLWRVSRDFLKGLFGRVGANKLGVYNALFIGNYRKTPFGVHVDPESVFHIPFVGTKKMRVWTDEYANRHPLLKQTLQYDAFMEESELLESGPGGIIYWPANAWHISELDGGLSVSMALSMNCFKNLVNPLMHHLLSAYEKGSQPADEPVTVPFDPYNLQRTATQVPAVLQRAGSVFREIASEKSMQLLWLKLVTGANFLNVPLPEPAVALTPADWISGIKEYPLVYLPVDNRHLAVSANGHIVYVPNHKTWHELLKEISSSERLSVGRLLDVFSNPVTSREDLLKFLGQLLSIRGIVRTGEFAA